MREALVGAVRTKDRGLRRYYADLDTMLLGNVDTAEGIWSTPEDGIVRGGKNEPLVNLNDDAAAKQCGLFPLAVVGDRDRMAWWHEAMKRANNVERRRWAKFLRRVLKHLVHALE